jgi:hypothetical protein
MVTKVPEPTFVELFTPKLVTILREGYGLASLRADVIAGLTVAIVALPLSMAIAIASGVTPDRGLYTAIIGGFLVSLLGGSRFQIGGPAGAFIVLVVATVDAHGIDGLILATLLSGLIMLVVGFLRLGTYIKYIPYPVTVGFTSGIAVIIFASQIAELLGLTLPGKEPGAIIPKLEALAHAMPTINISAVAIAAISIGIIVASRRWRPHWPACSLRSGGGDIGVVTSTATRDDRLAVRRNSALPASPNATRHFDRENHGRVARRAIVCIAWQYRKPAIGGRCRQHVRKTAPLQLRTGGPRLRQYWCGLFRGLLRHRYNRSHRHKRASGSTRTDRRHDSRGILAFVDVGRRATG